MTPEDFFAGHPDGLAVFERVHEILAGLEPVEVRTSKSQIAFRRRRGFAWVWRPEQYLGEGRGAPAVLSIGLGRRDPSPRWKEVVQPAAGQWMHHLEVRDPAEIDDEVVAWLREAYGRAG